MRVFIQILLLTCSQIAYAQVTLKMEVPEEKVKGDSLFIAGNFNNWQPADPAFRFTRQDGKWVFEKKDIPKGRYEFKFTQGSWGKVETGKDGKDISNRLLELSHDTLIPVTISDWKNNFNIEKIHTASKNVRVIDTAFSMPGLKRTRRIWVYLPPDYNNSTKRYPVIYMHDGQNLFDEATAPFGEWAIDETLDSLTAAGKPGAIVVGIDNSDRRMNEYNPYFFEGAGAGEADQYIEFIIKNLKPHIDKKFRTQPAKESTIIAGSSMGGLVSYYATLKHPSVFGRAGVFSPAFWTAPAISQFTDSVAPSSRAMFFFYMGELEGKEMMAKMNNIIAQLGKSSNALIYTIVDPVGTHNEAAWRRWFAEFYLWITGNGLNHIIR